MENEKKAMENQAPVEGEAKEVVKEKKEKFLVKVGKTAKKVVCSKPMKIAGRALLVAGSVFGTAAYFKQGTSKNYEALNVLDTPQFPDTQMAEIQMETETVDETE